MYGCNLGMRKSVGWTKRNNMSWGEKERADTVLEISFMLRIASPTPLFAGFHVTTVCLAGDPFFELTPKMGVVIFISLHTISGYCLIHVFTSSHLSVNWLSKPSHPLLPLVVPEGGISVFVNSTSAQKFETPGFFIVIFNYRSHSPMTGWPTTNAWLTWLFVDALSAFSFFFSSLSSSPEISLPFSF